MPYTAVHIAQVPTSSNAYSQHGATIADVQIAPFLLHHTSVSAGSAINGGRYRGTWLHNKVTIQPLSSEAAAIRTASYLARLRHPNVENFLGVVTTHSPSIVTAWISGTTLADMPALSPHHAAMLALDVARAVVYMHAVAGPHGNITAEGVIYEKRRERAVLLLSPGVGGGCKADDVKGLAKVLIGLLGGFGCLPKCLSSILRKALGESKERPTAETVCKRLKVYERGLRAVK